MIEVIYKEEKQEAEGNEALFRIPRNIRQIGLVGENYRIYMEDYVYTFLGKLAGANLEKDGCVAVLVGDTKWWSGTGYLFVRGALMVSGMEASPEHVDFSDEIWDGIQGEKETYFPDYEIVGWFFARQQLPMELTDVFSRAHLKHFGGEKVLMLMDPSEREDAFFRYENDHMARQSGYYIFYEKNPLMQTYMMEKNQIIQPEPTEKAEDEAVKKIRRIIQGKKQEQGEDTESRTSVFSYAATACLAIAVLTVGVNFYRNYQEVGSAQQQPPKTEAVSAPIASVTPVPKVTVAPQKETEGKSLTPVPQKESVRETTGNTRDIPEETEQFLQEETNGAVQTYPEESDERKVRKKQSQEENGQETQNPAGQETAQQTVQQEKSLESAAVSGSAGGKSYVIRPGDTLYDISVSQYGNVEAVAKICSLNGLSENDVIYPGQIIVLP